MRLFLLAGVAAPILAAAAPAAAQDSQPAPPDVGAAATTAADMQTGGDSITIGIGAGYLPDYSGSNDYRIVPAPAAIGSFKGFNFTLAGNRLSVDLIPDGKGPTWDIQAGPIGVVNFNRNSTKSIDDTRVKRLGELDTSIELGGYAGIGKTGVITSPYDRLSVTVSYRHDVSGVTKAGILSPSVSYLTPLSRKSAAGLFLSAERAERGYAQTYYGVTLPGAAASGLPVYNARGGWKNYTIGALYTQSITGDLLHGFKIVAGGTYTRLLNSYSYSPLVRIAGSPNQWLGAVGLAYTF